MCIHTAVMSASMRRRRAAEESNGATRVENSERQAGGTDSKTITRDWRQRAFKPHDSLNSGGAEIGNRVLYMKTRHGNEQAVK